MNLSRREVGRLLPWAVAIHEAGHAVVWAQLGGTVESATIVPGEDYAGRVQCSGPQPLKDVLAGLLAGGVAEKFFGVSQNWEERQPDGGMRYWTSDSGDWGRFSRALSENHPDFPYGADAYGLMEFMAPFMRNALEMAEFMVRLWAEDIVRVAAALVKYKTLSADGLAETITGLAS